ncbi:MAG: rRNA maturation RNase YbeY [Flavobacterium sp.]|nr:rRNA maturation RNase YbeY [Flavobacterium sp.]
MKNLTVYCSAGKKVDKRKIHSLVKNLKSLLKFEIVSFDINFISSEDIISINSKYLRHKCTTDIITFNYSGECLNFDGEIFISMDDASENAKKFKVSLDNEIVRLVVHGILHMLGYDDVTKIKRNKMKIMEDDLVDKFQKKYRKLVL